jgi:hypothetical protein
MKAPKNKKQFIVNVETKIRQDISVTADSFEEALKKAKEFAIDDLVTTSGIAVDWEIDVVGVWK